LTLPGGLLNALMNDTNSRVLQSPQVRAVDGQKVSMKIGEKVPYASGSFQPGIGGVGINPLVNTQFTFLDVGVNIDIVPKIHGTDEVSLHVEIDISNVKQFLNLGGVQEPDVAQTKIINDVRLKQGEVNLMGGLIQIQENKTTTGVPGLGSIPLIGHLFTSQTTTKDESELVIALIPHIVRAPDITNVNMRTIGTGNSTVAATPPAAAQPAPQPVSTGLTVPLPIGPLGPAVQPNAPPATAPPATAPPISPAKPEGSPATAPESKARVMFVPAQASTEVNGTVTVSLMVENAADLASTPMQVRFDPKILRLNDVVRGNLLTSDGQQVAFSKNVLNDTGEATVNVSRFPTTGGVSGSGSLVTFVFQAVGRGDTVVSAPQLTLRNSQSQPILTAAPHLSVSVK
jgi:general secretion pathway protein D